MDIGKLVDEVTRDWGWLSFLVQYCSGRNIGKSFCADIKWWALGISALVVVSVAVWIWNKLARACENRKQRRLRAKIANTETMKQHVWAGHDAHLTSSDQRARRRSEK